MRADENIFKTQGWSMCFIMHIRYCRSLIVKNQIYNNTNFKYQTFYAEWSLLNRDHHFYIVCICNIYYETIFR